MRLFLLHLGLLTADRGSEMLDWECENENKQTEMFDRETLTRAEVRVFIIFLRNVS